MMTRALTPLGELLEHARADVLHISIREAARRAGISEAHWRHVVAGQQVKGGEAIPVRPTMRTVVAMARAVNVEPEDAARAQGYEADEVGAVTADIDRTSWRDNIERQADQVGRYLMLLVQDRETGDALADEIKRIEEMKNLTPAARRAAIRALINLFVEEAEVEPGPRRASDIRIPGVAEIEVKTSRQPRRRYPLPPSDRLKEAEAEAERGAG